MRSISSYRSAIAGAALLMTMVILSPLRAQSKAQHPAGPTTPGQIVDQLLGMVEGEMVPLAEAMPADKYNFAPTNGNFKGVRTFAEQIQHVINANYMMYSHAASIKPLGMPNVKELKTKQQLIQALKDSFAFAHQAVGTLNNQNAMQFIKPVDGVNTRVGVMLFAIVHMNDHYGQMVEYLRMNGVVPPASQHP